MAIKKNGMERTPERKGSRIRVIKKVQEAFAAAKQENIATPASRDRQFRVLKEFILGRSLNKAKKKRSLMTATQK